MGSRALKIAIASIILIFALLLYTGIKNSQASSSYDGFAQCATENGAKMYGAYWCSHCQDQKKMFGASMKYIDYIECTQEQEECDRANVKGYPTWRFADGSIHEGEISFEKLAEKTGCKLEKDMKNGQ